MISFDLDGKDPIHIFAHTHGRFNRFGKLTLGNRFELTRGQTPAEVAQLIRVDIKQAIANAKLPKMEFLVFAEKLGKRQAICTAVTKISEPIVSYSAPNEFPWLLTEPEIPAFGLTALGTYIRDVLAQINWRYNSDGYFSDSQYPTTRFLYPIVFAKNLLLNQIANLRQESAA